MRRHRHAGRKQPPYSFDFSFRDRQSVAAGAHKIHYTWMSKDGLADFRGVNRADEKVAGKKWNLNLLLAVTPLVSFLQKRQERCDVRQGIQILLDPLLVPGTRMHGVPFRPPDGVTLPLSKQKSPL